LIEIDKVFVNVSVKGEQLSDQSSYIVLC
jgi:hypothetical protein